MILPHQQQEQLSPTCSDASHDESIRPLLKQKETIVLLSISFQKLALLTFIPSIGALLLVFIIGFGVDYIELLNYEWTCGKVLLPSISRIINLPAERVVWHLGMMLHSSLRPILIVQAYLINSRPSKQSYKWIERLSKISAFISVLASFSELFFTIALTVVGERESGSIHVYLFIAFITSCAIHQITRGFSCRISQEYKKHRQVKFCFKIRVVLTILLLILVPSIFLFFVLYWQYCIQMAYDFFAFLEYLTVLVIYAYHIVAIIDLRKFECHIIRCRK